MQWPTNFRCRVETESGGTRRRTGGEVKGKEANGVGSQQSSAWLGTVQPVFLQSFSADPHSKKASNQLNWHPRRYKWTRPFRWKTESGFCACAITFRFHSTKVGLQLESLAHTHIFDHMNNHFRFSKNSTRFGSFGKQLSRKGVSECSHFSVEYHEKKRCD